MWEVEEGKGGRRGRRGRERREEERVIEIRMKVYRKTNMRPEEMNGRMNRATDQFGHWLTRGGVKLSLTFSPLFPAAFGV